MKKVDLFILRTYVGPLIMTFFIALFILLMQFLWLYVDDLVGKGLDWYVLLELIFYASSTFVPMALPLAILLSSLMTFGNLGEHYELVALKSSGISLKRLMRPLVILSVIISILAFLFSDFVLPVANLKFRSLLYDVQHQKLAFKMKEGIFNRDLGDYVLRIESRGDDGESINDVLIYDHSQKAGNIKLTTAQSGLMQQTPNGSAILFTLYNGVNYEEKIDRQNHRLTRPFQRMEFKEEQIRFEIDNGLNRTNENLFKSSYHMMNLEQLSSSKDSLEIELQKKKRNFKRDVQDRLTQYRRLDSARLVQKEMNIDTSKLAFNSVFFQMDMDIREKAIDKALAACRTAKDNVKYQYLDFEHRDETIRKHSIAYHKKFTLSFACLILFFVGAPLGAIIRKGGLGLPVVMSTLFFVLFHVLSMIGERSAVAGGMNIFFGMWLASSVFLPLGVFLTYKATSDAPLFDSETYKRMLERLHKFIPFIHKSQDE
ncbi:MAG: LptF/LptG family permease [Bacteroidales bacterium]|nr:LptF/LptG family permease [Bacteroidales bacterium]